MVALTTGPIENGTIINARISTQFTVKISNRDMFSAATILIQGYTLSGTRTLYVSEAFVVNPNQVITRTYFANIDGFEYVFTITGAEAQTSVSSWGKNELGELSVQHRLVESELRELI